MGREAPTSLKIRCFSNTFFFGGTYNDNHLKPTPLTIISYKSYSEYDIRFLAFMDQITKYIYRCPTLFVGAVLKLRISASNR